MGNPKIKVKGVKAAVKSKLFYYSGIYTKAFFIALNAEPKTKRYKDMLLKQPMGLNDLRRLARLSDSTTRSKRRRGCGITL